MKMNHGNPPQAGFSLLELSIVFVILGILLSVSTGLLTMGVREAYNTKTDKHLEANIKALIGYAATSQSLPDNNNYLPILPYRQDSGGADFLYAYHGGLATGTRPLCGIRTTGFSLMTPSGQVDNVAFVLFSMGFNKEIAGAPWITPGAFSQPSATIQPYVADRIKAPYLHTFDDIVEYVTLVQLQEAAGCKPLQIVTSSLQTTKAPPVPVSSGTNTSMYYASIIADGGSGRPNYLWCVVSESRSTITLPATFTYETSSTPSEMLTVGGACSTTPAEYITINGTLSTSYDSTNSSGLYTFNFKVRDFNDTTREDTKKFLLTVNPP